MSEKKTPHQVVKDEHDKLDKSQEILKINLASMFNAYSKSEEIIDIISDSDEIKKDMLNRQDYILIERLKMLNIIY